MKKEPSSRAREDGLIELSRDTVRASFMLDRFEFGGLPKLFAEAVFQ